MQSQHIGILGFCTQFPTTATIPNTNTLMGPTVLKPMDALMPREPMRLPESLLSSAPPPLSAPEILPSQVPPALPPPLRVSSVPFISCLCCRA